MYAVNVMYPIATSGRFDVDHYKNVHIPLGVGLMWKHFQVKPIAIHFHYPTYGVDRKPASAPFAAITTMQFNSRDDAHCFIALFEKPEEAAKLAADWPNFTDESPIVVIGAVDDIATDDVLAQFANHLDE